MQGCLMNSNMHTKIIGEQRRFRDGMKKKTANIFVSRGFTLDAIYFAGK